MDKKNDTGRNRPTEKGRDNDPDLRDESAIQPGADTVSSSDTDPANQRLTRTSADSFRTEDDDPQADRSFDE